MARKKRNHMSRRAVNQRRERVLELRLGGLSASAIAEELRKEEPFKHTTEDTVWNDIKALKKRAKLEEVGPESIVNETLQKCRDSYSVISKPAHRRLKEVSDRIVRVQELIAEVDELLQDPDRSMNSRGELIIQHEVLVSLAGKLRSEARAETRVIISINRTLLNMPKKLGLIIDKAQIGFRDETKEAMIEAIENAPTPEARKELIKAAELFGRAFVNN